MGCGPSRDSTIRELNEIMKKLKDENLELETQRDNLKLQQELKSDVEVKGKNSLSEIVDLAAKLEIGLKDVKNTGVAFLPPNIPNTVLQANIIRTISIQNELEDKNEQIYELKNSIYNISLEKEIVQEQISDFEKKIKDLELTYLNQNPEIIEINYYIEKLLQLQDTKQGILDQIYDLEEKVKTLAFEIASTEDNIKESQSDAPSYEYLLTMNDDEIKAAMNNVEREIRELTDHLKKLKDMELEIEEMNKYVNNVKSIGPSRARELKKQVDESRSRVKALNREKEKLKNEIEYLSKLSNNGDKLQAVNEILDKNKDVEEKTMQTPRIAINSEIEATIRKAKSISASIRNKNL
ncbi:hypothetical protein SteCoe_13474 [Stentor coeruleus]|uniref:Uncharacterized protein n=1 Tax=Stentor coeruleus TaxID=5963 RepID=A0A1R2C896_9CILI|nr:hypothetical protein SteCoe_13474 [Stentor coeruleus]